MPEQPQEPPVDVLARRIFRFDTLYEIANLVARIDADTLLREAVKKNFYRLNVEYEQSLYCIILHEFSLEEQHQQAIGRYAAESGGTVVTDREIKEDLTAFALSRHLGNSGKHVRWDNPLPKTN